MRKKNKGAIRETSGLAKVLIYIPLILLSILIIVPVFWVFMASIKENSEFYRNPWALPEGFYFQNFLMLNDGDKWINSPAINKTFQNLLDLNLNLASTYDAGSAMMEINGFTRHSGLPFL